MSFDVFRSPEEMAVDITDGISGEDDKEPPPDDEAAFTDGISTEEQAYQDEIFNAVINIAGNWSRAGRRDETKRDDKYP